MDAKVLARLTVLLVAASCATACASGPSLPRGLTIQKGQRTSVQLTQVAGRQTFALQNESSGDAEQVYSDTQSNPLAKVVADVRLQALLDVFTAKGLFATSLGSVPPDARDVLTVEQGGQRWTWARRRAGLQAEEATFHEAKTYFLDVYNSSEAFHRTSEERPNLQAERSRVRQGAAAAKHKLETLPRNPQ